MIASSSTAMTNGSDGGLRDVRVAIIGARFGGLGVAIKLREASFDDFLVLERDEALGGTWWANTYPGCACDVPAHLYSYSFQLNPNWSKMFAPQPEILDYLRRTVRERGIERHLRLRAEVQGARWDEDRLRRGRIEDDGCTQEDIQARFDEADFATRTRTGGPVAV